jgi:hypothetical protein
MFMNTYKFSKPLMASFVTSLAKCTIVVGATSLIASCGGADGGVKGAKGETPAKYVICGQNESNCFVAARFKDLAACTTHKDWADMLCDSQSTPGAMTCKKDTQPSIAVAYCTL